LLKSPVPACLVRVRFAVPLPVAGILGPPLLRAVIADLTVDGICGNLAAMIFSTSLLLALCSCANGLLGMKSGRAEGTLAKPARPLKHSSRVAKFCFKQEYAGMI
jgi:hypothetical protein